MKKVIKSLFKKAGLKIEKINHDKPNPIHLWEDDSNFNDLYQKIKDYTLVDKKRCFMLYELAGQCLGINGDYAEVGVYKGGTSRLIGEIINKSNKELFIFDTFDGMPPVDKSYDLHNEGDFSDVNLKNIEKYLENLGSVKITKGFFPDSGKIIENKKFSFVHIDVDIFRSVTDCCEFFYSKLEPSGIMIFDDYGFISCPGAKKAVDDFFQDKKENVIYLPTGQALIIKI